MTGDPIEERVSLLLAIAAGVAVVLEGLGGLRMGGPFSYRLDQFTSGCNLGVALVALTGVLVVVLSPGEAIGRSGQRALIIGAVVGAVVVVGAVMNAASRADEFAGFQAWMLYVVPAATTVVPAGVAARFATEALRAR